MVFVPFALALMLGGVADVLGALGDFACILPEARIHGEAKREMGLAFYARLAHRDDDAKNAILREIGKRRSKRDE